LSTWQEIRGRLEAVPLFAGCNSSDLAVVARRCEIREIGPATPLIRAGEHGGEFFILLSGAARRGHGDHARVLTAGDYFGELALLDPAPRSADVITTSDSTVAVLSRDNFLLVLDAVPGLSPQLLALLARRLRERRLRDNIAGEDEDAL
jgi:CRP-like cAMP-binding protein